MMMNFNKSLIKKALFHLRIADIANKINSRARVAILRYHSVQILEDNFYASPSISLDPEVFAYQVRYLCKRYKVISLDELVQSIFQQKPLSNSIVFTFDDGYADNYYHAYRILKKHGATATFYLTVDAIENKKPLWVVETQQLLRFTTRKQVQIDVDGQTYHYCLKDSSLQARSRIIGKINHLLKSHTIPIRDQILQQLREQLPGEQATAPPAFSPVMLTWKQVREMSAAGMTIGAHTLSHPNLPSAGVTDAYREILDSKKILQQQIQVPVHHFSYPNGGSAQHFNQEIVQLVQQAGFLSATTSIEGRVYPSNCNLFTLPRIRTNHKLYDIMYRLELEGVLSEP